MYKFILIAILALFSLPVVASDATPNSINIAVVDVQQLMNESKAAKSIQSQGKSLREKYQKRIKKMENELKSAEKKVVEAGKEKNEEKFIERRKDFQKELIESQKEYRDMNVKLDKAVATALNKLRDEIVEIVDSMTEENKYDLVITRADVITVSRKIDITADVMKKLNKEISSIKVRD